MTDTDGKERHTERQMDWTDTDGQDRHDMTDTDGHDRQKARTDRQDR